jgi:hypothetical protein
MIQSVQLQKARIPALALGALALVALGTTVLPRLGGRAPAPVTITANAPAIAFEQRPLVVVQPQADNTACGAGAYVSGDVAGETSPAQIYATMCGR